MDRNKPDSDSDSDDKDEDGVTPPATGSYVNSRGLRHGNGERMQHVYTKVTGAVKKYAKSPKGKEGPIDSYQLFLNEGVINMNPGNTEDYKISDHEVNHNIIGVVMALHFSLKAGLKSLEYLERKQPPKS